MTEPEMKKPARLSPGGLLEIQGEFYRSLRKICEPFDSTVRMSVPFGTKQPLLNSTGTVYTISSATQQLFY